MMIHKAFVLSLVAYPLLMLAYFFCYSQFYSALREQRPEWLSYKGEPSAFYVGMPRGFDPNVSLRVIGVAFSSRASQLDSSTYGYARAIRIVLPISIATFGFILWYVTSRG